MTRAIIFALILFAGAANAQSLPDISSGLSFANGIAPTSTSQIANPSAVNSSAWKSGTGVPSAVPSGLGGFSTPNTSSSYLTSAQGSSLTALGNQAQIDCANYVASGDAYQTQYCAAVNFMNNQCMQATTGEKSVLGSTGVAQGSTTNCSGTYGAGASQYGYADSLTDSDSIFTGTLGLAASAAATVDSTCTVQTVVTKPAQYTTNTCVVSQTEDDNSCSQYLNATVVRSVTAANANQKCATGTLQSDGTCYSTSTVSAIANCPAGYAYSLGANYCYAFNYANATASCPSGTTYEANANAGGTSLGQSCSYDTGSYFDGCPQSYGGLPLLYCYQHRQGQTFYNNIGYYTPQSFSCPAGYSYNGSQCVQEVTSGASYSCASGSLNGQTCTVSSTTSSTTVYSCPSGTLDVNQCIMQTVSTSWSDTCTPYETSAGATLGVPTQ